MMNIKWCFSTRAFPVLAVVLQIQFSVACSDSDDNDEMTDTGSEADDTGSAIVDTGSDVADIGSAVNDTGSDVADTGSAVADTGSAVADTESAVADTGSETNDTTSETDDTESETDTTLISPLPVDLGQAGNFVILAKSGISNVPASAITGNLGVSPAAATYITGFSLTADSTNAFSTSPQVTGKVYASDYAAPTPSDLTVAVGDMEHAFDDAAGRAPDLTELGAGSIGGMTLDPGVYMWSTGVLISSDVTLAGDETDVWIFQIAGDLIMSSTSKIVLNNGARPQNIFWQVAGLVDLGTTSHCEGVILTKTSVTLKTGASINGKLLAQTAIDIDSSTVVDIVH